MHHFRKSITTAILAICSLWAAAESADSLSQLFRLDVTARVDWQIDRPESHTSDTQTGFKGRYFMLRVDGSIVPGLTYSWRQRINKAAVEQSFFDATDWLYVDYATHGLSFQVGKEIVAIGGWEYDRAPYDLYGCSVFWNNIPCYQLGASVSYTLTPGNRITAQITQSPFHTPACNNLYAYNLYYSGKIGLFQPLYSINMIEYQKDRYINYIMLGNRFTLGRWQLDLDLMNRAASHQAFLFKDCSVIGELSYNPTDRWRIHAKATYDVNNSGTSADYTVTDGTDLTMVGGGVEYYPLLKDRTSLRLHANAYYSMGRNANTADLMQRNTLFASIGVTWNMNLLNINRRK